jgi:glucokinase
VAAPEIGQPATGFAGVDLGGTKIDVLLVRGADHSLVGEGRRPTPGDEGPKAVAAAIAEAVRDVTREAGVELETLAAVGVGSPGTVDAQTGTVARPPNLASWKRPFPLASTLEAALGVPALISNDVGAAIEAELALGAGRRFASFLGVWWGTGVGGAVVQNGRRWLGRGSAGEIGHMVVKLGGARCSCGRRGCAEAYAGRAALERRARKAQARGEKTNLFELAAKKNYAHLTSSIWESALERGDALAVRLLDDAYRALGAAVASASNLLDLEAIVIGGGLGTRFGQAAADRIASEMLPHLFASDRPPPVVVSELGDRAGALGAALLAERARA